MLIPAVQVASADNFWPEKEEHHEPEKEEHQMVVLIYEAVARDWLVCGGMKTITCETVTAAFRSEFCDDFLNFADVSTPLMCAPEYTANHI